MALEQRNKPRLWQSILVRCEGVNCPHCSFLDFLKIVTSINIGLYWLKVDVGMLNTTKRNLKKLSQYECWVLRWPIGSMSASHQCGPGSIPGWGSDPGAVSEKGLSSPVWATLRPWVGMLSCWPSLPTSTNPIRGTLKNPQHFSKRVGESPRCWRPVLYRMH